MPQIAGSIFNNSLKALVIGPMDQAPYMLDIRAKGKHMAPRARATRSGWVRCNIGVDPLPMLDLAIYGHEELEAAGGGLILGAPVVLHHDRRGIGDAGAENLAGGPAGGATRPPEHLHLARLQHGDDIEVAGGCGVVEVEADVGLDQSWAALQNLAGRGDRTFELEGTCVGVALPLV